MKKPTAILALGLVLTHAAAAEVPATFVKLVGLSTVPDARCAFLLVLEGHRPVLGEVVLTEGKSSGSLELVAIDDRTMTAKIRNSGTESVLSFTAETPVLPSARALTGDPGKRTGAIKFQNLPLPQVLDFYAQLTGRTVLRPALLPVGVITVRGQNLDREGTVRFLERTLARAQLETLPQGDKFAVVLPKNHTLPVSAWWKNRKTSFGKNRSPAATSTKTGIMNFHNADLVQVLQFYGNLSGRTVERAPDLPGFPITFKTGTPLTDPEALYALDTVLALNGIQIVPVDDQTVKAVPANNPVLAAKNKPSLSK